MATDADIDVALPIIRRALGSLKPPAQGAKVLKTECLFSFDSAESEGGLYLNLATLQSFGDAFVGLDRVRHGAGSSNALVYLHERAHRVAVPLTASGAGAEEGKAPTKLAIGVQGGFATDSTSFEIVKQHTVIVFTGDAVSARDAGPRVAVPYPFAPGSAPANKLPAFLCTVIDAVLAFNDSAVVESAKTWEEEEAVASKYASHLVQVPSPPAVSPHPSDWRCHAPGCDKADNLWLNLSDGFIGCGRPQAFGMGGNGHALQHFQQSGGVYPLCVKLGTITPAGADVYSYAPDEDTMVLDPHLAAHLAHFGINIMSLQKTEKSLSELQIDMNMQLDFSRISESDKELQAVSGPGFIGLENLGNSCYINSTVQVLAAMPEWRDAWLRSATFAQLAATASKTTGRDGTAADDILLQTAKLVHGLYSGRYEAEPRLLVPKGKGKVVTSPGAAAEAAVAAANAVTLAASGASSADAAALTNTSVAETAGVATGAAAEADVAAPAPGPGGHCGFVQPRMWRNLVGRGHAEFASAKQQDAPHFLEWLYGLFERAYTTVRSSGRIATLGAGAGAAEAAEEGEGAALPVLLPDLLSFYTETRLQCQQSGMVRYTNGRDRFWRLNIPTHLAVNGEEVSAAKAARDAAVAAEAAASDAGALPAAKRARTNDPALPKFIVPWQAVVRQWAAPGVVDDWQSPATGVRGRAVTRNRLASCPPYLTLVLNRYTLAPDWTQLKIDAEVSMPLEFDLRDIPAAPVTPGVAAAAAADDEAEALALLTGPCSLLATGLQPGEALLPASGPAAAAPAAAAAAAAAAPQADAEVVALVSSMGFSEAAATRACLATGNSGADAALEWIMAHMDDADLNDPIAPAAAPAPAPVAAAAAAAPGGGFVADEAGVAMLTDMGIARGRAIKALKACDNNLERATDWVFSHMDDADDDSDEAADAGAGGGGAGGAGGGAGAAEAAASAGPPAPDAIGSSRYVLFAIVSHMGSSTSSGHYVAHIRKGVKDGRVTAGGTGAAAAAAAEGVQWYLFNDSKVAVSENPPLEAGYMYFYRRV